MNPEPKAPLHAGPSLRTFEHTQRPQLHEEDLHFLGGSGFCGLGFRRIFMFWGFRSKKTKQTTSGIFIFWGSDFCSLGFRGIRVSWITGVGFRVLGFSGVMFCR